VDWTAVSGISIIADPVGPVINDGTWHNVVLTLDRTANQARTYIDGPSIDTRTITGLGTLVMGQTLTIGQDPSGAYGNNGAFDLDDLGIWRRSLSDYEVQSIYGAAQNSGQSFNVYGPVMLHLEMSGSDIVLAWQAGTLLKADNLTGPWTPVAGASAPFIKLTPSETRKFYRVQL
jgi:hypothetical protein